jgi:hypothetical protein
MYNFIMHQQLWGYKVEEKLNLGVREQNSLNTAALRYITSQTLHVQLRETIITEGGSRETRFWAITVN